MLSNIEAAIAGIKHHLLILAKPQFSPDDLRQLFIAEPHREPLTRAFELCHGYNNSHSLDYDIEKYSTDRYTVKGAVRFNWHWTNVPEGFFTPSYTRFDILPTAPLDLVYKFNSTIQKMVDIEYEWTLVDEVFHALNHVDYCRTPEQMRYVWPAILQLVKRAGMEDLARRLQHPSVRAGDKARVPWTVYHSIRESYDIVTRSIFLEGNPPERPVGIVYNVIIKEFLMKNVLVSQPSDPPT